MIGSLVTMRIVIALATVLSLAGCSGGGDEELLVSAAASLTDAFGDMEQRFEDSTPGVDVILNLAGSSTLREQILGGAPADVFASADIANMDQLVAASEIAGQPRAFARNLLQIAVPAGNPAGIRGLDDFSDEQLLIGLCAEGVPCGDLARKALDDAGVVPSLDTNEPDVRSLLTKIEAGELDAGITYVTDVASTDGAVEGIHISDGVNVVTDYSIAVVSDATNQETADAFIEYVLSAQGQSLLAEFGFISP